MILFDNAAVTMTVVINGGVQNTTLLFIIIAVGGHLVALLHTVGQRHLVVLQCRGSASKGVG